MGNTITLRSGATARLFRPRPDDAHRVLGYLDAVASETDYLSFGPGEHGLNVAQERAYLASFDDPARGLMLAAEIDGELAALASVGRVAKPRIQHVGTFGITVRQRFWGQGLGGALTERCVHEAGQLGMWRVELRVRTDNVRAQRVYEKLGFVVEGRLHAEMFVHGEPMDSLLMAYVTLPV